MKYKKGDRFLVECEISSVANDSELGEIFRLRSVKSRYKVVDCIEGHLDTLERPKRKLEHGQYYWVKGSITLYQWEPGRYSQEHNEIEFRGDEFDAFKFTIGPKIERPDYE